MKSLSEIMAGVFQGGKSTSINKTTSDQNQSEKILQQTVVSSPPLQDINLPLCDQLYSWQREVVQTLKSRDVFIIAGPGAGKTLPILCFWFNHILGLQGAIKPRGDYPIFDLLVTTSNRAQLVQEIGSTVWCVPTRSLARELFGTFCSILTDIVQKRFGPNSPVATEVPELVGLALGGLNIPHITSKLVTVGTYDKIASFSPQFFERLKLVVIDEAHLMFDENLSFQDRIKRVLFLLTILRYANKARIAFLTGTLNPNSVLPLIQYMRYCFNRNLQLVYPGQMGIPTGNPSVIKLRADDHLPLRSYLKRIVVSAVRKKQWGNVVILFSVNAIRSLAEDCLADLRSREMQVDISASEESPNRLISRIKDPFLRKCALAGFGFHYRGRPEDMMDEDDKQTIEDLFKKKQIYFLIATDSIGIGVNLEIQNLYLPETEKNYGKMWEKLREKDLVQLLNRVGRTLPVGTIYTPTENLDFIYENLIKRPHELEVSPMLPLPKGFFCRPTILAAILRAMRLGINLPVFTS